MSNKRNRNKKSWERSRNRQNRRLGRPQPRTECSALPQIMLPSRSSELDQISAMIVEENIGRIKTTIDTLRAVCGRLPCEPVASLLAMLAGRVEACRDRPAEHLRVAEEFYGSGDLVDAYRRYAASHADTLVFAPQSLYALIRIVLEEAYDAPIQQDLSPQEREDLATAVVASNSITERGIELNLGPLQQDLLAYELQVGHYYHRGRWLEDLVRHHELYRLATTDEDWGALHDAMPIAEWIERSGLTREQQWQLGFGFGSLSNAWNPVQHPHMTASTINLLLERLDLAHLKAQSLDVIANDRAGYLKDFDELAATGKRLIWELRPFQTRPFLRVADDGLLLIGRPWLWSWLSEGFHYRPMRIAQQEDRAPGGRRDHVQRYTAYAGQVFERYCLELAREALEQPARVYGEQSYNDGGSLTSDVAVVDGEDLILFEANARRVGAEPLLTGDPLDATSELGKLIVKKVNQLGVCIGALLDGTAALPEVEICSIQRIWPVVVASGHVWQTATLWTYLDSARDAEKCRSLGDERVAPLQLLDADDYEMLLALAEAGHNIPELLKRKTSGPWRHRDLAVWLNQDKSAPDHRTRLTTTERVWQAMTEPLASKLGTQPPAAD